MSNFHFSKKLSRKNFKNFTTREGNFFGSVFSMFPTKCSKNSLKTII